MQLSATHPPNVLNSPQRLACLLNNQQSFSRGLWSCQYQPVSFDRKPNQNRCVKLRLQIRHTQMYSVPRTQFPDIWRNHIGKKMNNKNIFCECFVKYIDEHVCTHHNTGIISFLELLQLPLYSGILFDPHKHMTVRVLISNLVVALLRKPIGTRVDFKILSGGRHLKVFVGSEAT